MKYNFCLHLMKDAFSISISHSLPPIHPWTDDSGNVHSLPLSIIAKFVKSFCRARYKLKNKLSRDLAGLSSVVKNKIFISKSLTQTRKKLFKATLKVKKELNLIDLISTTKNSRIFLTQNKDSSFHLITANLI